jgi:hypothetical protein
MREIRLYGSEGGGAETNRSFLPLSVRFGQSLAFRGERIRLSIRAYGRGVWVRRPGPLAWAHGSLRSMAALSTLVMRMRHSSRWARVESSTLASF